tara:strand:- start:237261 stop:237431 length:171 start_codon:yes stop_codon:yes gene_type:complete
LSAAYVSRGLKTLAGYDHALSAAYVSRSLKTLAGFYKLSTSLFLPTIADFVLVDQS